ncbi:MAG: protoheme IX farnesyltransferase [Chitinophagaceae bacterium]|nr:MAG: protoheme IX farnesyltransferase [Chitinophagaceae bacterium]
MNQTGEVRKNSRLKDYLQLVKPSLSIMVVFSSVVCFLLVPGIDRLYPGAWLRSILLFVAGMLVTGSANTINQVVEKDTDAKMKRTATRPVASGRMSEAHGWGFAIVTGVLGVGLMWYYFNGTAAVVSAFSLFLYAFVYTPLKKVNAISVFVGAFPGALPCLIGWVAGTGVLWPAQQYQVPGVAEPFSNFGGWVLFAIQFLWQFPHFWAIAWVAHRDYSSAGFKLLPSAQGPTKFTALQTIIYSLLLIPVCALCYYIGLTGVVSLCIVTAMNLFLVFQCVRLYRENDAKAARRVMFTSYAHLAVVLLALLADKIG